MLRSGLKFRKGEKLNTNYALEEGMKTQNPWLRVKAQSLSWLNSHEHCKFGEPPSCKIWIKTAIKTYKANNGSNTSRDDRKRRYCWYRRVSGTWSLNGGRWRERVPYLASHIFNNFPTLFALHPFRLFIINGISNIRPIGNETFHRVTGRLGISRSTDAKVPTSPTSSRASWTSRQMDCWTQGSDSCAAWEARRRCLDCMLNDGSFQLNLELTLTWTD